MYFSSYIIYLKYNLYTLQGARIKFELLKFLSYRGSYYESTITVTSLLSLPTWLHIVANTYIIMYY